LKFKKILIEEAKKYIRIEKNLKIIESFEKTVNIGIEEFEKSSLTTTSGPIADH